MSALSTSVTRTWNDLNGDRSIFNSNLTLQENELGPSTNANFGKSVQTTTVDPALLDGWGLRPYWIIGYTANYGPNFLRPTQVLSPRLFKIGAQVDF